MAFSPQAYGVVSQVTQQIYHDQKKSAEKSNTVVTAIGAVITALIAAITYLMENGVAWLPEWSPLAVTILGLVGTVFGVSRTKNGLTKSIVERINDALAEMIDAQQRDRGGVGVPEPAAPVTTPDAPIHSTGREVIADALDELATRIAERR